MYKVSIIGDILQESLLKQRGGSLMPNFSRECYEDWINKIMDDSSDDGNGESTVKSKSQLTKVLQRYERGNNSNE